MKNTLVKLTEILKNNIKKKVSKNIIIYQNIKKTVNFIMKNSI